MEITLKGRVALVTGGGAGIGHGIVEGYAALGAQIVIAEIKADKCEALRREFPEALIVRCDVRNISDIEVLRDAVETHFGKLDVLVNNVGHHLASFKTLLELSEDDWDAQHAINLRHMFLVTRTMLPLIQKTGRGGSIINVSSIEGFRGCPTNVAYTTFKHAVTGFTRALAIELSGEQIRVNVIAPETTDSEQCPLDLSLDPDYRAASERTIALGRFGKPSDHAGAAIYLATDLSTWVTGTTMFVDGGSMVQGPFLRLPDDSWTVVPIATVGGVMRRKVPNTIAGASAN